MKIHPETLTQFYGELALIAYIALILVAATILVTQ